MSEAPWDLDPIVSPAPVQGSSQPSPAPAQPTDPLAAMRLLAGTVTRPNEPDIYRDPQTGAVVATGHVGMTPDGSGDFSQIRAAAPASQAVAVESAATSQAAPSPQAPQGQPAPAQGPSGAMPWDADPILASAGYEKALTEDKATTNPTLEGAGDAFLNGLTFNNADTAKGAMAYLGATGRNLLGDHSISPGDAFAAEHDLTRDQDAGFAASHPVSNFALNLVGGAPIGEGAGALIGKGAGLISDAAGQVPAWLARAGVGVPVSAAVGGAYGAGANKADPLAGAVQGAEIGGALGVGLPILGGVGGAALSLGRDAVGGLAAGVQDAMRGQSSTLTSAQAASAQALAQRYLAGKLTDAGLTPSDISASPLASRGGTVAEALGPDSVADAASIIRRPGAGAQLARDTLQPRADGRTGRLLGDVAQITGVDPTAAQGGLENVVQAGQAKAAPLYDAVRTDGNRYMTRDMKQVLQTPAGQDALGATYRDLQNAAPAGGPAPADVGITLDGDGRPMVAKGLRPLAIDALKRNLDVATQFQPFGGATATNANKAVDAARDTWVSSARQVIPGYADALDAGGDYKTVQSAYKASVGLLFGAGTGKSVQDAQNIWSGLGSEGERDAVRSRFAADIVAKADAGALTPGVLQRPGVYQKLSLAFGADKADALVQAARHEASLSATGSRLTPNTGSITADALSHGDAQDAALDTFRAGMHAVHRLKEGKPISAAIAGITHLAEKGGAAMKTPYNQATRDALARLYLGDASNFASTFTPPSGGATPYLDAGGAVGRRVLSAIVRAVPTAAEGRSNRSSAIP